MEPYAGNRPQGRGSYSNNNMRNQNRQGFRRTVGPQPVRTGNDCGCQNPTPFAASHTAAFQPASCPAQVCDNGASASPASYNRSCANDPLFGMTPAMAYVPWQQMSETCEPCEALQAGTIFPDLNFPFLIGRCATCR